MKKVKHIILTIIIIFNCLILSVFLLVFFLINKDDGKTKGSNIAQQNEYQTKAGEGYSAVPAKLEDSNQKEDMEIYAQRVPLEEEVYAMREKVLEGMSEEEISRLKENIRIANLQLEHAYFNENIFEELSDSESLYWNYFDEKGSIQLGWYLRDVPEYDVSSGMSYSEYMEKYGEPSMVYNRFDAVNFIELMEEMKDSLKNDWLKPDFDQLIEFTRLAKETHDVTYAKNIYYILHDMDYFLLRYGLSEIKGVTDPGILQKYYHILEVYKDHIDELEITPAYLGEYTISEIAGRSKISGMTEAEAEKFIGGYLRVSPSQMFIIGDYVGSTDISGYVENIIPKNEFEEAYHISAKDLMSEKEKIVQVTAEVVERSNRNYSMTTFFILDEDTILLTQDGIFLKAIRKNSTLKSDIYNKFMDYNSFLEFDGIIQAEDFDGDGKEDYLIKSPLANTNEATYYIRFHGSDSVLFLGAYEWGYLLSVECVDVDNNGSKELIVMGTNDHTYSVEDTATFEIYEQTIWDDEIKWDKVRVPKGSRLMLQGADWDSNQMQRKSGFDYLLISENNQYKLSLGGTTMGEYEIILPEGIVTEDLELLVDKNVARPIYKYEVVKEASKIYIRLYQNIGTGQHIIGKAVTTIAYYSKDGLTDYVVKKVEFGEK